MKSAAIQAICKNSPKTVVFFWTSWCGVSRDIIKKTYQPLMDSIRNHKVKMNVVMLCGNEGNDSLVQSMNLDSNFHSIYISEPGNGIGFVDRKHIRNFIKTNFTKASDVLLKEIDRFSFGIPITLVVNEKMEIVMERAPQDLPNLIEYCSNK